MNGIIHARLVFPDRIVEDGTLLYENGVITACGRIPVPAGADIIDAKGLFVGPGFVDQHVHGYQHGHEAVNAAEDPARMAECHLRHGTTSITPSAAYSNSFDQFLNIIDRCREAIASGTSPIIGIHFEGPFTNPIYGANGDLAWHYSKERFETLLDRAGEDLLHCTYAPEMPDAAEIEQILKTRGIRADIGHSCAGPENMERAFANGASIITHLFDAMGCYLGKEHAFDLTGDVQNSLSHIALGTPGVYCELICDSAGAHVTPYNCRMAFRAVGEDHIILITDCTTYPDENDPAEGSFSTRADDLNFNTLGQLAGSRLTMDRACANFMHVTGADVRIAFKCASTNPAKALGIYDRVGSIHPGKVANLVFVDDSFHIKQVIFRGKEVVGVQSNRDVANEGQQ